MNRVRCDNVRATLSLVSEAPPVWMSRRSRKGVSGVCEPVHPYFPIILNNHTVEGNVYV